MPTKEISREISNLFVIFFATTRKLTFTKTVLQFRMKRSPTHYRRKIKLPSKHLRVIWFQNLTLKYGSRWKTHPKKFQPTARIFTLIWLGAVFPYLRKGLAKDAKETLLREHNVPDNCRILKAPCLIPEFASAVADIARFRDTMDRKWKL